MCPKDLKENFQKTKAVIPVHMLGFPAKMDDILKFVKIKIIEDNCESVGGKYKDKKLGTFGDLGILSFDFGKNITTGEGGAILTNNKKLHKFCKEYHDHGHELNPNYPRGEDTKNIWI